MLYFLWTFIEGNIKCAIRKELKKKKKKKKKVKKKKKKKNAQKKKILPFFHCVVTIYPIV